MKMGMANGRLSMAMSDQVKLRVLAALDNGEDRKS